METIELQGVELRPERYFDVTVEAEAVTTTHECSGTAGEQSVTESWEERDLEEFEIVKLVYWTDSETPCELPVELLNHEDRATIFQETLDLI
jgi:hypothetical protein